jgi:thioesterase domain-containing protein
LFIAKQLKFDCPIYGIRSKVLDSNWVVPNTLREYAVAIFSSIKKVQPKGPYYFLGECIASSLTLELQLLAEESGESANFVFLINSHPLSNRKYNSITEKTKHYYWRLKRFYSKPENLFTKVKRTFRRLKNGGGVTNKMSTSTRKYLGLLYSCEPIRVQSGLHLLLSYDENKPQKILKSWQPFFEKQIHLYHLNGNHSAYHEEYHEDSSRIAAILDDALFKNNQKTKYCDTSIEIVEIPPKINHKIHA